MRKNSIKNIRINEEVMRELSNIIRGEIKDPRINPMTSVVAVEVAPDLKTAKAYISVLGMKITAGYDCRTSLRRRIYSQKPGKVRKSAQHTGDQICIGPVH